MEIARSMDYLTYTVATYHSKHCRHTTINLVGNDYLVFIDTYLVVPRWTLLRLNPVLVERILNVLRAPITDEEHQIEGLSIEYVEHVGSGEHDGYRLYLDGASGIIELGDKLAFMEQLENGSR